MQDKLPAVKRPKARTSVSPSTPRHSGRAAKSSGASNVKGLKSSKSLAVKSPSLSPKGLSHTITPSDLFSSTSDLEDSDDSDVAMPTAKAKEEQKEGTLRAVLPWLLCVVGRRKRIRRLQTIQTKVDGMWPKEAPWQCYGTFRIAGVPHTHRRTTSAESGKGRLVRVLTDCCVCRLCMTGWRFTVRDTFGRWDSRALVATPACTRPPKGACTRVVLSTEGTRLL